MLCFLLAQKKFKYLCLGYWSKVKTVVDGVDSTYCKGSV